MTAKSTQGSVKFKMAKVQNGTITAYGWFDSGPVRALSTFHDGTIGVLKRKKVGQKERVDVTAPIALKDYNDSYHGVDVSDQMRAALTISRRTQKWWKRMLDWIIDVALINAFLLFKALYGDVLPRRKYLKVVCCILCGFVQGAVDDDDNEDISNSGQQAPVPFTINEGFLNHNVQAPRERSSSTSRVRTESPVMFLEAISSPTSNFSAVGGSSSTSAASPEPNEQRDYVNGVLASIGAEQHLLWKTSWLQDTHVAFDTVSACVVCQRFKRESNIRTNYYCLQCKQHFHHGCYILHHTRQRYQRDTWEQMLKRT
jgi:hypothetical protein